DSSQPNVVHTLPSITFASGATPLYLPPEAAPEPAMMLDTWVPCPTSSVMPSPVKSCESVTTPDRSGWVASYPVSSTATVTPCPVNPACQAAGTPIWGLLTSSSGLALPSSQILETPAVSDRTTPPAVTDFQNVATWSLGARRAAPLTLGSARLVVVPLGAARI